MRDTEALVKKLNRLAQEADEGDDDERQIIIDYVKDLEDRARNITGRQIKIKTKGKNKVIQVEFADNEDLEELLVKLCGKSIIEGVL